MTRSIATNCLAGALALLALTAPVPAGLAHPNLIRHVMIGGVRMPAYYSIVEGGYRPLGRTELTASLASEVH